VLTRLPGGAETVVRSASPERSWTAVTTTTDPGAMGSVSSTVVVSRDLAGLLRLKRIVYEGAAAEATWIRPSVLQLPGGPLDVVSDDADVQ